MIPSNSTLILTRSDVAELLPMSDCIAAVENAFAAHASGHATGPAVASLHVDGGGFHIKAAALQLGRPYFAAKTNGNFFNNERLGLPRIQGSMMLSDASDGRPLAILDSLEITTVRTAAATAVAARHLARSGARKLAIVGCGVQGRASWLALETCFELETLFLYDPRPEATAELREEARGHADVEICHEIGDAIRSADIVVTATPSRTPIVTKEHLHPGLFIAAVGADSAEKQEIDAEVLRSARVVADVREQAVTIGDSRHAIDQGHPAASVVDATLGEIIVGSAPGRQSDDDIIVFDSTGTALQDVAAAAIVYERALAKGRGLPVQLSA